MKKIFLLLFAYALFGCENTDDGTTTALPELTTEGKNTYGCTVDGVNFLPKARVIGSPYYTPILLGRYVYDLYYFNGYHFVLYANNEVLKKYISIELSGGESPLVEGATYPITVHQANSMHGFYEHWGETVDNGDGTGFTPIYEYTTNDVYTGELEIVKLDTVNKIISGRFWFDCVEIHSGELVRIRDGRFDVQYTIDF